MWACTELYFRIILLVLASRLHMQCSWAGKFCLIERKAKKHCWPVRLSSRRRLGFLETSKVRRTPTPSKWIIWIPLTVLIKVIILLLTCRLQKQKPGSLIDTSLHIERRVDESTSLCIHSLHSPQRPHTVPKIVSTGLATPVNRNKFSFARMYVWVQQ